MSPADLAQRLTALDWTGTSLQHQLAVGAAVETLREVASLATEAQAMITAPIQVPNVVVLPTRKSTRWTVLHQMDGRPWARSSHFGPEGAWGWVVETVAQEHGVSEDQVGCAEGEDGGDFVTIDGLPVYQVKHEIT